MEDFEKSAEERIITEITKKKKIESAPSILFPIDSRYPRWRFVQKAGKRVKSAIKAYGELEKQKKKFVK